MEQMYKTLSLAAVAAMFVSLPALPAAASDASDVAATIRQYNDDFNKGDAKAAAALCTERTVIIDDFAPHLWQGATACRAWSSDLAALEKKDGISNDKV